MTTLLMMRRILVVVLLCCSVIFVPAEQLRIVVPMPEIIATTDKARKEAAGYAALWQSLLSLELSRRDLFAVIERDDLLRLVREWELAASQGAQANRITPAWLAADCLVIGKLAITNQHCCLTIRLLNAENGAIEKEWVESFSSTAVEQQVKSLAPQLQKLGLMLLARRNVHTLVSVLDFESLSPFDRNRWLETALARRLRGVLQRQPGVLVLERENVTALFGELRLKRGGLATGSNGKTNHWASLHNYFVVSGRINESQPDGQPLAFALQTQIKNLIDDGLRLVENKFLAGEIEAGLMRLEEQVVCAILQVRLGEVPAGRTEPDRAAEALTLANKAVQLMKLPEFKSLNFIDGFSWALPPYAFSDSGIAGDATPPRRSAARCSIPEGGADARRTQRAHQGLPLIGAGRSTGAGNSPAD